MEERSPPYRFYPTAGLSWKRLKGGRATSALPDARARGNLTARLRRGFPDEAPLPPLQQPVSALEGLHTTLTGTGAANYYWKPTPYRGKAEPQWASIGPVRPVTQKPHRIRVRWGSLSQLGCWIELGLYWSSTTPPPNRTVIDAMGV